MAQCLECGKELASLAAHLRTHKMTKDEYLKKYPEGDLGYDIGMITRGMKKPEPKERENPVLKMMSTLSEDELAMYKERYEVLWKQADMDPALEPSIRDIVMAEIYVLRYQGELSKITQKIATNPTSIDIQKAKTYQSLIKDTQEQTLKSLNALNLTREKKQALKKSPETTPSRIISNYILVHENMTPIELEKDKDDEQEALRRLNLNAKKLFPLIPTHLGEEPEKDSSVSTLDTGETSTTTS